MKDIPGRGNALETEHIVDDSSDCRFENLYREKLNEKLTDYHYYSYLRFHPIYDTFDTKRCML